jgi:hypothetical protein
MFLSGQNFAVPELLDTVLNYVDRKDLANCLRVNRQFKDHAQAMLYKHIALWLYPWETRDQPRAFFNRQPILCKQLLATPSLALNINKLSITINRRGYYFDHEYSEYYPNQPVDPTLESSVLHILQHGRNINEVVVIHERDQNEDHASILEDIIRTIVNSENRPKLFLSVPVLHHDDWLTLFESCTNILVSFSVPSGTGEHPGWLSRFLSTCTHLRHLDMSRCETECLFPDETDLATICERIPLQRISSMTTSFKSLPNTLRFLHVVNYGLCPYAPLTEPMFSAICSLEHLSVLELTCKYEGWKGFLEPSTFKSSNLTHLEFVIDVGPRGVYQYYVPHMESPDCVEIRRSVFPNILQPMLDGCPRLESIKASGITLWPESLVKLFAGQSLRTIDLELLSHASCNVTFEDIADCAKNAVNLCSLIIPWPHFFELPRAKLPQRLSFDVCNSLAVSLPHLDVIQLRADRPYPYHRTFKPNDTKVKALQKNRFRSKYEWETVLSVEQRKVEELLDPSSPCLDVCTFTSGRDIKLSLDQVRKHLGYPYAHFCDVGNR